MRRTKTHYQTANFKTAKAAKSRFLVSLIVAALGVAALLATPAGATSKVQSHKAKSSVGAANAAGVERQSRNGFMSNGRFVKVDVVRAQNAPDTAPGVLILHGSRGLGDGSLFYPQAQALAEAGISAFVVHYYDGLPSSVHQASPALHDQRDKILEDAISWVQDLPYVDHERIGVFGLSLGGFHALSLASRDVRIGAIVDVSGALPAPIIREGIDHMPPTLILHGDRDPTVPVRRAYELANLLDDLGTPYELNIYKGQGHGFRGAAQDDSVQRTVEFFGRYLTSPS